MTSRRFVLTLTALPLTPLFAMWAAHTLDHATGWYDPQRRT